MKKLIIVSAIVIGTVAVRADDSMTTTGAPVMTKPFQASLAPDIAIYPHSTEIDGFAINIWGENPQHSLNLGFVNGSTGDSSGFSVGLVNYDDNYTGVQWGIVNYSKDGFKGWEDGMVNISKGAFTGWQDGWVNYSEEHHGLQSGLINYSERLHGVQIGLINIAMNNGWFDDMPNKFAKGFPIVNWSF